MVAAPDRRVAGHLSDHRRGDQADHGVNLNARFGLCGCFADAGVIVVSRLLRYLNIPPHADIPPECLRQRSNNVGVALLIDERLRPTSAMSFRKPELDLERGVFL